MGAVNASDGLMLDAKLVLVPVVTVWNQYQSNWI